MRRYGVALTFVSVFGLTTSLIAMTLEERQQYWDKFSQVIPVVPSFTKWQQDNNSQPPDYDAFPKSAPLPDPLTFADGKRKVVTAADWAERRAEIVKLYEQFDIGTIPPKPALDQIIPVDAAAAAAQAAAGRGRLGRGPTTGPAGAFGRGPTTGPSGFARGRATTGPFARGGRGGAFAGRGGGRGGPPPAPGSV
ncbi:MAG: hypothetical protein ABSH22_03670, partial [Tepidisphaeraceae bacterium]